MLDTLSEVLNKIWYVPVRPILNSLLRIVPLIGAGDSPNTAVINSVYFRLR